MVKGKQKQPSACIWTPVTFMFFYHIYLNCLETSFPYMPFKYFVVFSVEVCQGVLWWPCHGRVFV